MSSFLKRFRKEPRDETFVSFQQSILAVLPFTKENRESRNTLQYQERCFHNKEKERIEEIQNLVRLGRHEEALRELLLDTDESCGGLIYYNKIKHGMKQEGAQEKDDNEGALGGAVEAFSQLDLHREAIVDQDVNSKETTVRKPSPPRCTWQGFNSQGCSLQCTNRAIQYPWKTFVNVYGDDDAKTFDFCLFHQKYCVDNERRHVGDFVKIVTPNQYGLCRECYIAKEGKPPVTMKFIPGMKKVVEASPTLCTQKNTRKGDLSNNRGVKHTTMIDNDINDLQGTPNKNFISFEMILSAILIQRKWRHYKRSNQEKIVYEQHRKHNVAALRIQLWFRYQILRRKVSSRAISIRSQTSKAAVSSASSISPVQIKESIDIEHDRDKDTGNNEGEFLATLSSIIHAKATKGEKKRIECLACPLCQREFFHSASLKKHIVERHTKLEIEGKFGKMHRPTLAFKIQWIGDSINVPPFDPPVLIDICQQHVPPHPRCRFCTNFRKKCDMFPPLKFYQACFVEKVQRNGEDDTNEEFASHLAVKNKENGIVVELTQLDGHSNALKICQVGALCEDVFGRAFIGLRVYYTYVEIQALITSHNIEDDISDFDVDNEVILDTGMRWISMDRMVGICDVLMGDKEKYLKQKERMSSSRRESLVFCRFAWDSEAKRIVNINDIT